MTMVRAGSRGGVWGGVARGRGGSGQGGDEPNAARVVEEAAASDGRRGGEEVRVFEVM